MGSAVESRGQAGPIGGVGLLDSLDVRRRALPPPAVGSSDDDPANATQPVPSDVRPCIILISGLLRPNCGFTGLGRHTPAPLLARFGRLCLFRHVAIPSRTVEGYSHLS